MATKVKCLICNEYFDREKVPCVQIGRRYAHKKCTEGNQKQTTTYQEREDFWAYIKKIYGPNYNFQLINKQATEYIEAYKLSWSDIKNTLRWFYEIKGGDITKGEGIGILPFIYEKANEYYKQLALTREKNEQIKLRQPVINIRIKSPRAWKRPPRQFDWGDDE